MSGSTVALLTVTSPPGPPDGVAAYSIALARALASLPPSGPVAEAARPAPPLEIVVWAQRPQPPAPGQPAAGTHTGGPQPGEESPPVIHVWRPGVLAGPDVVKQILRRRPAVLHVQVEFAVFGGAVGLASMLAGLAMSRALLKQRVVVTLHQVPSLHDVTPDWLRRSGVHLPAWMARAGIRAVFQALSRLADAVIVHAEIFRERLRSEWRIARRVHVVPHGVAHSAPPRRTREPRLLLFGYLKWYKGVEIGIEAFRRLADEFPEWMLTVAGSPVSPSYQEALRTLARPLGSRVEFLGRVEELAADELFARAGLVLFPYRLLFSASGPLARVMGAAAPFVISEALRPLCPTWPHWAPLEPEAWVSVLRPMMRDVEVRAAAADLAAELARAVSWPAAAAQTHTVYETMLSLE